VVFTPSANYNGPASFSYTISDGHGGTSTASVSLTVNSVNDAPTGTDKTVTLLEDGSYKLARVDFGFSDSNDSPPNNFAAITLNPASAGALRLDGVAISSPVTLTVADIDAGRVIYSPAANASGVGYANFSFAVKDDGGTANGGIDTDPTPNTITFNVTPVNDAPVGTSDAFSAVEGTMTTLSGSVLANDSDVDGPSLTVSQFASSASGTAITANGINTITTALGGTVVMNTDGSFRYIAPVRDHADAVSDVDSFVYKASDGSTASGWTTVNVSLTDSSPSAVADSATVGFNSAVNGNLLFSDLGADTLLRRLARS